MYYNYHAKIKKLIRDGELVSIRFFDKYNNISPALVFYFKKDKPMPIREYRFEEYFKAFPFLEDLIEKD